MASLSTEAVFQSTPEKGQIVRNDAIIEVANVLAMMSRVRGDGLYRTSPEDKKTTGPTTTLNPRKPGQRKMVKEQRLDHTYSKSQRPSSLMSSFRKPRNLGREFLIGDDDPRERTYEETKDTAQPRDGAAVSTWDSDPCFPSDSRPDPTDVITSYSTSSSLQDLLDAVNKLSRARTSPSVPLYAKKPSPKRRRTPKHTVVNDLPNDVSAEERLRQVSPVKFTERESVIFKPKTRQQCDVCLKMLSTRSTLAVHKRIHSGAMPYACSFCGKKFRDFSSYTKHDRIHTGARPYSCDVCGQGFSQSGNLKRHALKLHPGRTGHL
ncbi:zinc finger and SCAN domain-containing protein 5B-like [Lineus longissimus]|uniref:zinc finger and SCAN domain-containing protein 5B-like n=1 Tax=Lineus longissimus TaxID=88925 RepID=UPI00315DFC6C